MGYDPDVAERSEYTASDVLKIITTMGLDELLDIKPTHPWLNAYRRALIVVPTGHMKYKGRSCYRFADIVALCFVLEMRAKGVLTRPLEPIVKTIQARERFEKGYTLVGQWGVLEWKFHAWALVKAIHRAIEEANHGIGRYSD